MFSRGRTAFPVVLYGLYLVLLGLSFRAVLFALRPFVRRSHLTVCKGCRRLYTCRCMVWFFLVDEAAVIVG